MTSSLFKTLVAATRPGFLILTPCCLLVAAVFALADNGYLPAWTLSLIVLGGLSAHISVNMFNEYADFVSGLDLLTERTPFSGGSGGLPAAPQYVQAVKDAAIFFLLLTVAIGGYFIWQGAFALLPVGVLGVGLIYFYTGRITHHPWLCLIAPGLAFGPLMINGAYYVLSGGFSIPVFSTSLIVFCLVNNLLLLNQFPDVDADRQVGRRHFPVLLGRQKSLQIYFWFLAIAFGLLLANVGLGFLPGNSLIALVCLVPALRIIQISSKAYDNIEQLRPAMALNVLLSLLMPVLIASGLLFVAHAA